MHITPMSFYTFITIKQDDDELRTIVPSVLIYKQDKQMIRNEAINNVTYWEPSAGNIVSGIIQGIGATNDLFYDKQKTLFLQEDDGAVVVVELNRYLLHSLKQHNADLGDFVTVTFHGKEQKNNGRSFNRYTLVVDKVASPV